MRESRFVSGVSKTGDRFDREKEARADYASLVAHMEDAVIATDERFVVTAWNPGAERLYGRTAGEVLGRPAVDVLPCTLTTAERAEGRRRVAEGGRSRVEVVAYRKDGSPVDVEVVDVAIRNERSEIIGYLGIHRDVSKRKRAEEALREAPGRAETILDAITDEFFALDREWRYTYVNRRGLDKARGIRGRDLTAADLLGACIWELFPQLVGTTFDREAHRAMRDQTAVELEEWSPVTGRWVEVRMYPSQGFLSIYLHDISERKRIEEAVREAQQRSATILESITDNFVAVDHDWRYTYLNDRALRSTQEWLGRPISRDELLGRSLWEVFPDTVGAEPYVKYHQAIREGRSVEFETYFASKDRWFETRAYPSESGLSVYFRDVSDRKRMEQERERRAHQQTLVAELGLRALASDDPQSLMDEAVALVARTLDVKLVEVAELPAGSEDVIRRAGVGWREGVIGRRMERGRESQVGYTLLCREPVVSEDQATDPRFTPSAVARDHGAVSALSVMIESPEEPFGVLVALSTRRRTFAEGDVSFVQSVANVLAGAVERSRAQERLGEVREIERSRIARDLHDQALQELTDALVQADRGRPAGLGSEAAEQLVSTLQRVAQQLRAAIYDLRLGDEVSAPFPEALRALVDVHRAIAVDCEIGVEVDWEPRTGPMGERGIEVLRIVGEALTNARRHSGARTIRVSARGSPDSILVEVTDDGRGLPDAAASGSHGMGVKGMRERAALLGGELDIRSCATSGTTVHFEIAPPTLAEPPTARARVLLVEDHAAVRQAIAAMFQQQADLDVVGQAASLAEGRGMLRDVDVAVVDLGLPDGYGGDLIRELHDVNAHAQALVLSASLDPAEIERALDSGAAVTLNKTADLDQLVETVRRLHRGAGTRGP